MFNINKILSFSWISKLTGFEVLDQQPIDKRFLSKEETDRLAIPETVRYPGLFHYVAATNKLYLLRDGISNSHWVDVTALFDQITNPIGGGTNDHNALLNVKVDGNNVLEATHLNEAQITWLRAQMYTPPVLSVSPNLLGSNLEVGDVLNLPSQSFNINIANVLNVLNNVITIDNVQSQIGTLPLLHSKAINDFNTVRGFKTLMTVSIQRSDNSATLTQLVRMFQEYKFFYILTDDDLGALSDAALTTYIRNNAQNMLLAPPNAGANNAFLLPVFNNNSGVSQNIWFAFPNLGTYGDIVISSLQFPNPNGTTDKTFSYTNGSVTTSYKLKKVDQVLPNGGNYEARFYKL